MTIMKTGWTYMPHMSPWANMHLGFTRPNFLMDDGTNTLHRAETIRSSTEQISQPEAIVISNFSLGDFSKEYFILENRAPVNLIGVGTIDEGLALWLVHEDPPFPGDGGLVPRRALQLMRPQIWAGGMDCSGTAASRTTTICRPRRRRRTPTGRTVHRAISTSETSRPPVQR